MFFTTEILSKRDSGIGLIWMAATLGKTSIGRLSRRSVLKADIRQLCEIIAEPAEPLALRLSSNLLVGVVRVYKVKHDIFLSEVTNCFTSLKRTMLEMSAAETSAALDMAFGSVRPDTITFTAPEGAIGINIDLDIDGPAWEDFFTPVANRDCHSSPPGITSQDFTGTQAQTQSQRVPHTLEETHADLLAGADDKLDELANAIDLGQGLDFGNLDLGLQDAFGDLEQLEDPNLMDIDPPTKQKQKEKPHSMLGATTGFGMEPVYARGSSVSIDPLNMADWAPMDMVPSSSRFDVPGSDGLGLSSSYAGSRFQSREPQLPPLIGDQRVGATLANAQEGERTQGAKPLPPGLKKPKKQKGAIQDKRADLEENEMTAENYTKEQGRIRIELELRRRERDAARVIDMWMEGVPHGFNCPALDDWLKYSFKSLVDANSHKRKRHEDDGFAAPAFPTKRKREETPSQGPEMGRRVETPMNFGQDYVWGGDVNFHEGAGLPRDSSVEAPEHGMRAPQAEEEVDASQRSTFFPWDPPGVSSSTNGDQGPANLPGSVKVDHVSVKIGRSSQTPSRLSASPGKFGPGLDGFGDGFEFPVIADERLSQAEVAIERNSFKFLEYIRMQERALADDSEGVWFSSIAPAESSTAHVAAAAFYHTLALATKSVVRVKQPGPFADFSIQAL